VSPVMTESKSAVALTGVSKSYGAVHALIDVSIEVAAGEVVGLVGENGAGKSTLIGVLSGSVRPDHGELRVDGEPVSFGDARTLSGKGVSVVTQEQALVEALRVYENLFLGRESAFGHSLFLRKRRMRALATKILQESGLGHISADAVVSDLTYPQRQLVEIAKAFAAARMSDARPIILLDEPTSALSESEAELLFGLIERWRERAAFIYVSHILRDVLRLCSRLVILKDGQVVDALDNVGVTDSHLHELMVGRERSADYYREEAQGSGRSDQVVVQLKGAGSGALFRHIDLTINAGEVVGFAGVVGSGKSELAAAIAGAVPFDSGSFSYLGQTRTHWKVPTAIDAGVLYVPPERATDSIFASASVRQNISIGILDLLQSKATRLLRLGREREMTRDLIKRMSIKTASPATPLGELSGGNQQKAVFARWLERPCQVLILDDPTRGIDVGTREEIYTLIRDLAGRGVAIVLCSESLEELIGLSNRIVVLKDGELSAEIPALTGAKPGELDIIKHMM